MKKMIVWSCLLLSMGQVSAESSRDALTQQIASHESHHSQTATTPASTPFFKNHVLLFFFASSCPHCHHQAPILKDWANNHGVTVDARTLDDKPLPEFPTTIAASASLVETAFRGNSIRYPALFVMNPSSGALYPVAIGSMSSDELNTRMQALVPKIIAYEQGGHS